MKNHITFHQSIPSRVRRASFGAQAFILLLLPFLLSLLAVPARAQKFSWAVQTNNLNSIVSKVVADQVGNTYVLSGFEGTTTVGGTTFTASGFSDLLLARYRPDGTLDWVRQISSPEDETTGDIVLNRASGLLYISGSFKQWLNFKKQDGSNGAQLVSAGGYDGFLAMYNLSGTVQWARRIGGTGWDDAKGLDVDQNDRVYVAGSFNGTAAFPANGPIATLTSAGKSDIYIAKYNKFGALELAKRHGLVWADFGEAIAVNKQNGDIYVTGGYSPKELFGVVDFFVARYNALGILQWSKTHGSVVSDVGEDIVTTPHGVYVAGHFAGATGGTISFGGATAPLTSSGKTDLFLLYYPYAMNGTPQWAKRFGGTNDESMGNLEYRAWDNGLNGGDLYISGSFSGTTSFGNVTITSSGHIDMFLAHFNLSGTADWAIAVGGPQYNGGARMSLQNSNTLFMTGVYDGPFTLGNSALSGKGSLLTRIDLPTVKDFGLIRAANDADAGLLASPAEINYMTLGTNQINIRATTVTGTTQSVRLILDGGSKIDNTAPFTWAGDVPKVGGTDYFPFSPSLGAHTLEVIPYSGLNATGIAGQKRTLQFTVVNKPVLTDVTLINALSDGTVKSLVKSPSVDYVQLGTKQINLRTLTNPGKVGSVKFVLDGVTKYDNTAPYSWAGEQINLNGSMDYLPFTLAPGLHHLLVTAYTAAGGMGTASNTLEIRFTVTDGTAGARLAGESLEPEASFARLMAAPNPFGGRTSLSFTATEDGPAILEVHNAQGQLVERLFEGTVEKGKAYRWEFDGTARPAGLYVARLKAGHQVLHQRLVLGK
jgi:hypothetical protein